ncbi:actin-associated protein FAM107A-like isoform X1 [Varanus komodoensis]|uniref:actin-associated protein FAM107A-like isoform X1 n=1 Tax=Varanus komodoensis TaxID=61221 RepID=UPI001CF7E4CF|nr:actin-associated protein FAM107A-like isoform X1 [Varanus komodoensis]
MNLPLPQPWWVSSLSSLFLPAAACSETTRSWHAISSRATNPSKVSQNQEQLHRELLFTHRKGLNLRSKPELLQVLENRNRRRDGMESDLEQSPLEQELLRWQQRRKQQHQQEATSNAVGNQPEFIRIYPVLSKWNTAIPVPSAVLYISPITVAEAQKIFWSRL